MSIPWEANHVPLSTNFSSVFSIYSSFFVGFLFFLIPFSLGVGLLNLSTLIQGKHGRFHSYKKKGKVLVLYNRSNQSNTLS